MSFIFTRPASQTIFALLIFSLGYFHSARAANTSGLSSLGAPLLGTDTYTIRRPLGVPEFGFPPAGKFNHYFGDNGPYERPILENHYNDEDIGGVAGLNLEYGTNNVKKEATTFVDDTGFFFTYAHFKTSFPAENFWGVLSETTFTQGFRKDTDDAKFKFTISKAELKTQTIFGEAIADFAADVQAFSTSSVTPFWEFHQHAGIHDREAGLYMPGYTSLEKSGPMTVLSEQVTPTPDHTHTVSFAPYTGTLDLSNIDVGEEFTVILYSMSLGMGIAGDGVADAYAYFQDPISLEGGITVETSGLSPTNNPIVPNVPLPISAWLFVSGLGFLFVKSSKKFE